MVLVLVFALVLVLVLVAVVVVVVVVVRVLPLSASWRPKAAPAGGGLRRKGASDTRLGEINSSSTSNKIRLDSNERNGNKAQTT